MISRADFSDEQWYRLRSAPYEVAMAVVEVDSSGALATGRELQAVEDELERVRLDPEENGLMRLVAHSLRDDGAADTGVAPDDLPDAGPLPERVLTVMAGLPAVLAATVEPGTSAAFRSWLARIGAIAASGAREGFAGVAGPKVSDAEQAWLDRLDEALGLG